MSDYLWDRERLPGGSTKRSVTDGNSRTTVRGGSHSGGEPAAREGGLYFILEERDREVRGS